MNIVLWCWNIEKNTENIARKERGLRSKGKRLRKHGLVVLYRHVSKKMYDNRDWLMLPRSICYFEIANTTHKNRPPSFLHVSIGHDTAL